MKNRSNKIHIRQELSTVPFKIYCIEVGGQFNRRGLLKCGVLHNGYINLKTQQRKIDHCVPVNNPEESKVTRQGENTDAWAI